MNKVDTFYPLSTPEIIHKGKLGNIYRLDGIEKCVQINEKLLGDPHYLVIPVSVKGDSQEACDLITVTHSQSILEAYRTGQPNELANSSGVMWQHKTYEYVLENAICCKKGVESSMKKGLSIILSGGGHHAERDKPLGFCLINSMSLSANYVLQNYKSKVALIDLDVHFSNGCFDILGNKDNVLCMSIWNKMIDKWKYFDSSNNVWQRKVSNSEEYFSALVNLCDKVSAWSPNFVVYHLGLDVLETDRMGGVPGFSLDNLFKREETISQMLTALKIPYLIFLGGSYVDYSKSDENIFKQKISLVNSFIAALDVHLSK